MNIDKLKEIVSDEVKVQKRGWFDFLIKSNIAFEGEKEGEKIIVFTRRHWIVLLKPIVGGLMASLLPIIIILVAAPILVKYNLSAMFTLLWTIYLMMIWFFIFYRLTMHSLDTWIVTDQRIMDICQIGLFSRKVSELHLSSIEDISVRTDGIIQSYFNFGDVEIQTAGAAQRFLFDDVSHPLKIKDSIMSEANLFNPKG